MIKVGEALQTLLIGAAIVLVLAAGALGIAHAVLG